MDIFTTIFIKLIPLYLMIYLGYLASQKLHAQKETIATLLIYIIAPVVIFYGTYTATLSAANLSIPLLFFVLCSCIALIFLYMGGYMFGGDSRKNILAFTAGTGNTGYFGLPVILMVFGEEAFSLAVLAILGFVLYENSVGFFLSAKGNHTVGESISKVIKLPTIYAFFLGLLFNYGGINLGEVATTTIAHFKGAYTLLGMMIIGMGLAGVTLRNIDRKFIGVSFFAKFLVRPLIMAGIIYVDKIYLGFFGPEVYNIFVIMGIVPLAANTVAVATELDVHPNKAAIAVLLSTMFALFYIPLLVSLGIA